MTVQKKVNSDEMNELVHLFLAKSPWFERLYKHQFPVDSERAVRSLSIVGKVIELMEAEKLNLGSAAMIAASVLLTIMHQVLDQNDNEKTITDGIGTVVRFN